MSAQLDRVLEPRVLAAREWRFQAETPLSEWPRLAALDSAAAEGGGTVRLDVGFRENEAGKPVLEGELGLALGMVCQRCLEPVTMAVRARPKLVFAAAEQIGEAASEAGFEACEPEPGTTLRQLLEDEVLLALPVFPAHASREECGALAGKLAQLEPAQGGKSVSSPFAVLADMKRKN